MMARTKICNLVKISAHTYGKSKFCFGSHNNNAGQAKADSTKYCEDAKQYHISWTQAALKYKSSTSDFIGAFNRGKSFNYDVPKGPFDNDGDQISPSWLAPLPSPRGPGQGREPIAIKSSIQIRLDRNQKCSVWHRYNLTERILTTKVCSDGKQGFT